MGQRPEQTLTKLDIQMASKYMKRCSTSYAIRELQIKTIPTHLLEGLKSKTLTPPNADKDVEQQELSFIVGGNAKWYIHFGRQFGSFLQNST